jgi:ribonuclease D
MNKEEAKELLLLHAFMQEDSMNTKAEQGFLGMLRPFQGILLEENYHEVMEALQVLADDVSERDTVDREIMAALWSICHLSKAWAIHPEGMLRRNNLITDAQVEEMETWIEDISYATLCLLDGAGFDEAFHEYMTRKDVSEG